MQNHIMVIKNIGIIKYETWKDEWTLQDHQDKHHVHMQRLKGFQDHIASTKFEAKTLNPPKI